MGNRNTKRTTFCSNNGVKKDCLRKIQKNFKQKPKQSELPLDTETSGQLCIPPVDSSDENAGGGTFYKFVILHAEDDTEEAIRVQDVLQNEFSIKPGIIFAEMPSGKHVLENFSDAVNGAAWIVILLTENFLHELWCEFQSYASMFNALIIPHKCNTVIPLRPRNNPLPWNRTPFILQTINALQEDSPGFAAQVKRTFQESRYRQQQAIWWHEKKGRHKNSVDGESVNSFSEAEGPFF